MTKSKKGTASSAPGRTYEEAYGFSPNEGRKPYSPDADSTALALHGVDHTARPTWKLKETIEFYRDVLKLPLIHCISARGWGPPGHHDFLHFFFDSGNGSTIAFFYYIGADMPEKYRPEPHHFFAATHTAWRAENEDELIAWKEALERRGVSVSSYTRHEVLESIYFVDPNGYPLEISLRLRDIETLDSKDAALTLEAALVAEQEALKSGAVVQSIDEVWRQKARLVEKRYFQDA